MMDANIVAIVIPLLFGGGNSVRYVFRRRERRFKAEAVRKHLREFAEGDARPAEWEVQTRAINEDNLSRGERPQEPLSRLRAVGLSDRSGIARFRGGTAGGRRRQGVFRQCLAVGRHFTLTDLNWGHFGGACAIVVM